MWTTLTLRGSVLIALIGILACQPKNEPQAITTCLLNSMNDQAVSGSGTVTDQLKRTFAYSGSSMTAVSEQSPSSTATFTLDYANELINRATSGQDVLTMTYPATSTLPSSATFTRAGQVRSTFTLGYSATGQLTRITENRQVLLANSLVSARTYSFAYDNAGNLTSEFADFRFADGSTLNQETAYTFDTKPSPYTFAPAKPMLTLVALSQTIESKPGKFWQLNTPVTSNLYNLNADKSRGNLVEASTFKTTYDTDNKPMSQDQSILQYTGLNPTPTTRTNRQTFSYQCQ